MTYKETLEKLGYNLQDCGNHWRTRAIYRNGKTNTSVIIYKDSGVWRDFGADSQSKPFNALVKETLNTDDPKILSTYLINLDQHNLFLNVVMLVVVKCIDALYFRYTI